MTPKLRLLLIVPGALFLVALSAFEFGVRKGRATAPASDAAPAALSDSDLVATLFAQDLDDRRFDFPGVIRASSGRRLLPFDAGSAGAQETLVMLREAIDQVVLAHNSPDSPIKELSRINEASRYFEDSLRSVVDSRADFSCTIPQTAEGKEQRSGYPDLRIEHLPSGLVTYLDPKLFAEAGRDSTLRTFYFEPQKSTAKVTEDACHLLLGISHDGVDGDWTFLEWEVIDLATLRLRLKAEFQASNRDLYRDARRVTSSTAPR